MTALRYSSLLLLIGMALPCAVGCEPPVARTQAAEKESSPSAARPKARAASEEPRQPETKWGALSGKFRIIGDTPEMKPIKPTKDTAVCGAKTPLSSENLVKGKDGELANVVVYAVADSKDIDKAVSPIHPSFDATKGDEAVMKMENCRFEPHIIVGRSSQPFAFVTADGVDHNADVFSRRTPLLSPTLARSSKKVERFSHSEEIPFVVTCSIHPWMKGHVLIRPDPYFAVSASDGSFKIENLPAGEWTFRFWHESLGWLSQVSISGKTLKAAKGLHKLAIQPGTNDLGKIVVDAADYSRQLDKLK